MQLLNGSFLVVGTNNLLYSTPTLNPVSWTLIPGGSTLTSIKQLQDGSFIGVASSNNNLYSTPTLNPVSWRLIPGSSLKSITQCKITLTPAPVLPTYFTISGTNGPYTSLYGNVPLYWCINTNPGLNTGPINALPLSTISSTPNTKLLIMSSFTGTDLNTFNNTDLQTVGLIDVVTNNYIHHDNFILCEGSPGPSGTYKFTFIQNSDSTYKIYNDFGTGGSNGIPSGFTVSLTTNNNITALKIVPNPTGTKLPSSTSANIVNWNISSYDPKNPPTVIATLPTSIQPKFIPPPQISKFVISDNSNPKNYWCYNTNTNNIKMFPLTSIPVNHILLVLSTISVSNCSKIFNNVFKDNTIVSTRKIYSFPPNNTSYKNYLATALLNTINNTFIYGSAFNLYTSTPTLSYGSTNVNLQGCKDSDWVWTFIPNNDGTYKIYTDANISTNPNNPSVYYCGFNPDDQNILILSSTSSPPIPTGLNFNNKPYIINWNLTEYPFVTTTPIISTQPITTQEPTTTIQPPTTSQYVPPTTSQYVPLTTTIQPPTTSQYVPPTTTIQSPTTTMQEVISSYDYTALQALQSNTIDKIKKLMLANNNITPTNTNTSISTTMDQFKSLSKFGDIPASLPDLRAYQDIYTKSVALTDDNYYDQVAFDTYIYLQDKKINELQSSLTSIKSKIGTSKQHPIKAFRNMSNSQVLNVEGYLKPDPTATNNGQPSTNNGQPSTYIGNGASADQYPNYLIYGNNGCLQYNSTANESIPATWSFASCNASKPSQQFYAKQITDKDSYNNPITDEKYKIKNIANVDMGFYVVNPISSDNQCLQLNNDGLSVMPCNMDSTQRFKPMYQNAIP